MPRATRPASASPRSTPTAGTATCRASALVSVTAFVSTDRTRRTRGIAAIPRSCCSIRTRRRSTARSSGTRRSSATASPIPKTPGTTMTARRFMPKGVVLDSRFDWEGDTKPGTPLHKSVIYEVHVKGFTARHPEIPEALRGTYAGLAHPASLKYLHRARRHRGRTASGPPVRARLGPRRARPAQLLGLQLDLRSSRRTTSIPAAARTDSRSTSSRTWCARCTAPASR